MYAAANANEIKRKEDDDKESESRTTTLYFSSYSKSSNTERGGIQNPATQREEVFKIQQHRESERKEEEGGETQQQLQYVLYLYIHLWCIRVCVYLYTCESVCVCCLFLV